MTEINRLAIECLLIHGKDGYSPAIKDMAARLHRQINKKFKTKPKFGSRSGSGPILSTFYYSEAAILIRFKFNMAMSAYELYNTRQEAKKIFKEYMDLKAEIIQAGSYHDYAIRELFNAKKQEWCAISNKIRDLKQQNFVLATEYNLFDEYIIATQNRIKTLEEKLQKADDNPTHTRLSWGSLLKDPSLTETFKN